VRAAALYALSAIVLLAGCTPSSAPAASVSSGAATSARNGPIISPPPVTPPSPPGDDLPAFKCADVSGGTAGSVRLTAVRVGMQDGYDRFVLQFDSAVPAYTVKRQAKPVFTQSPSGQQVTLSGTAGLTVLMRSATGANDSYTGPLDFTNASYPVLKEAKELEDFEGTLTWGLGLGSAACFRVFTLKDPARLVIDFQAPGS
jgi:hypothetical protein